MNDEHAKLRQFVEWCLKEGAFQAAILDPCDIQEKAIELGLVELRPIQPEQSIDGESEHYFPVWFEKK